MSAPDMLTGLEVETLRALIVRAGNALASMGPDAQSDDLYDSSLEVWEAENAVKKLIAVQAGRLFATGKMHETDPSHDHQGE